MQKKIALFGDSDSQIFGFLPHAHAFKERGWNVSVLIDGTISIPENVLKRVSENFSVAKIKIETLPKHLQESKVDVAGIYSRASKLHQFRHEFSKLFYEDADARPGIFTGYNGLTYEKFEEGLAWRLGFDVIALNGPRDQLLAEEFINSTHCCNQPTVITGLAPCNLNGIIQPKQKSPRKSFVFAEQVVVPTTKAERRYLIFQLLRIATNNPDWDILIKCRVRRFEKTFHDVKHHMEGILREFKKRPENLKITYDNLPDLLDSATLFGTVSSTALFEALNKAVPSIVVSDFGVKNSHGTHVFSKSGLSTKLAHIENLSVLEKIRPTKEWLNWVGAVNIDNQALIDFFEERRFEGKNFQQQYHSKNDIEIWSRAKTHFKFSQKIRWLLEKLKIIEGPNAGN